MTSPRRRRVIASARAEPRNDAQIVRGYLLEDREFRPEGGDKPVNHGVNALALRPDGENLANDFRERNEIIEARGPIGPVAIRAVSKLSDPVQNADGERFMTVGAGAVAVASLLRLKPDPALTVPVQVILALFGIELDRPAEPVSGAEGFGDSEEVHRAREVVASRPSIGGEWASELLTS